MIFPQEEEAKYILLQNKIDALVRVASGMAIKSKYDTKFQHIVRILSSKLVGCTTEKILHERNPEHWGDSTVKLTRRGLVQSFGYRQEKFKLLESISFIINPTDSDYFIKINKSSFMKLLSNKSKIQDKDNHARLLEALADIHSCGFYGFTADEEAKDLVFDETIKLTTPLIVQKNCNLFAQDFEGWSPASIGETPDEIVANYIRIIITDFNFKVDLFNNLFIFKGFGFQKSLDLESYIRISEPAIYSKIIEVLYQTEVKIKDLIKTTTEKYDKVCEKYSDILAIQALIEDAK